MALYQCVLPELGSYNTAARFEMVSLSLATRWYLVIGIG